MGMTPKERALGSQQLAAITVATSLTVPSGTNLALVIVETNAVRWRDDGTAPTASVGYPLAVGAELRYTADSLGKLQFIPQTGAATVNITYYERQA